jgi:nitrate reductase beta subunit
VPSTSAHEEQSKIGFWDARFGVGYPEGFEVFRRYKGQEFRAKATNGVWIRSDTGARYPSLNKLNESIAAGSEDVWRAWEFRDQNGKNRSIDELRQKSGARFLK